MTPGRRIYALGRVLERAKPKQLDSLVAAIEIAIAHDRKTLELDAARREKAKSPVRDRDLEVDRTLVMIERLLSHYARSAQGGPASELLGTMFPVSLTHHIQLPFVEQAAANERVLGILEGDTHASWLEAHGLSPLIKQLRTAHGEFAAALHARDSATVPTWDEVKAARERGQELYLQIVVMILADFGEDHDTRDELLEPVFVQDRLIQDYRRQRRNIVDVDPDSGEILELGVGEGEDEAAAKQAEQTQSEPAHAGEN